MACRHAAGKTLTLECWARCPFQLKNSCLQCASGAGGVQRPQRRLSRSSRRPIAGLMMGSAAMPVPEAAKKRRGSCVDVHAVMPEGALQPEQARDLQAFYGSSQGHSLLSQAPACRASFVCCRWGTAAGSAWPRQSRNRRFLWCSPAAAQGEAGQICALAGPSPGLPEDPALWPLLAD